MNEKIDPFLQFELENNSIKQKYELILRYTGDLSPLLAPYPEISYQTLLGGYAIVNAPRDYIEAIALLPEVVYLELPKAFYFTDVAAKQASCILSTQNRFPGKCTGAGTLIGILDSGIDYKHPDFIDASGKSRIYKLWDQTLDEVYSQELLTKALSNPSLCPSTDLSGHGTHVAGIAGGNQGVAYECEFLIVKLAQPTPDGFPSTTQIMRAVDFCVREALTIFRPLALNLSFGNTYGAHDGSTLLETYLDTISQYGILSIVVGTGNEGNTDGHATASYKNIPVEIEWSVSDFEKNLTLQIWKTPYTKFTLSLIPPYTPTPISLSPENSILKYTLGQTNLSVLWGASTPYSLLEELYLAFEGRGLSYIEPGIWKLRFNFTRADAPVEIWMPASAIRNQDTRFFSPNAQTTLTIPSTASRVIPVGAYDLQTNSIATFSGRGYPWNDGIIAPLIVAPGVSIASSAVGGGTATRSGTSMATPFVTGACSCLMQWGVLEKNDIFLYGEKLKAKLLSDAIPLSSASSVPNPLEGYGTLCLKI